MTVWGGRSWIDSVRKEFIQLVVEAALLHQVVVRPAFDDAAFWKTTISSAWRMVLRRWAITMLVRWTIILLIASWTRRSLSVSIEKVASTRIRMGGFLSLLHPARPGKVLRLCRRLQIVPE